MSAQLAAEMKAHLARRERMRRKAGDSWTELNFVFTTRVGTPISPRNVKRSLDLILERAGIPHITIHGLRRSAATFALADGVPAPSVQQMLGHADVSTTLGLYTKTMPETLQHAVSTLDRMKANAATKAALVTDRVTDRKRKHLKRGLQVVVNKSRARSSAG